jgi:hypothetical protein
LPEITMKNYLALLFGALLLSGCATTIRSDVTAFHAWPAQIDDKSYRFDAPSQQNDTLEYRSYQSLVRTELDKLGFIEATAPATPELTVAMQFSTTVRPVRVVEVVDPFWNTRGYGHGYYRGPWAYRSGYPGFSPYFSPFYDPFMHRQPEFVETIRDGYDRQLEVNINARDGRKLFDVTVRNSSTIFSTALVMPAMVKSAFVDFPGQSGVPHQIELKLE